MHHHRTGVVASPPRRANTPPSVRGVHGLGVVDALAITFEPAQLPWLAEALHTIRHCLEDELSHRRADVDGPPDVATCSHGGDEGQAELERRAYQLGAVAMIRSQVPISDEAASAATSTPWREPTAEEAAAGRADEAIAVVGPAALMTVVVRNATLRVAEVFHEAIGDSRLHVDSWTDSTAGWRGPELPHVTPEHADALRAMAASAAAFADTYLQILAQQTYRFDPAQLSLEVASWPGE